MIFNINDVVRVKLTSRGHRILAAQRVDLLEQIPALKNMEWPWVAEDEDGWSEWQLWKLMQTFGPFISMGAAEPPFHLDIEIPVETGGENG